MQAYVTLIRRELGSYFSSMTGFVIIAASMFLLGLSFVVMLVKLQQEPTPMPITELFYITPFFWLILLLATPMITMRLFAHERFTGTFETLMTAPVSDLQVVLAKFTSGLIFYMLIWLPLLGCVFVVRHYTNDQRPIDFGTLGSTYLGILALGCLFISFGCCASAMTRSQVTAAMIAVLFGASIFLLGVLADQLPSRTDWQAQVLAYFALFEQMHDFSRGVVDTRPLVFLGSLSMFFLFLTLRIVESRRWK